jgi:hypothetical protein
LHTGFSAKSDTDAILGSQWPTCRALHVQGSSSLLRNHLRPAIRSKYHGLLSTGVLLLHDNTRPHTAHVTAETISDIHFECLPYLPYSPDFTSCEYHIFGLLKEALGLKTSWSGEKCKRQCICDYVCNLPWLIQMLVECWRAGTGLENDKLSESVYTKLAGKNLRFSFDWLMYFFTFEDITKLNIKWEDENTVYWKMQWKTAYVILAYSHKSAIVNIIWCTVISVILKTGTIWADSSKWLD